MKHLLLLSCLTCLTRVYAQAHTLAEAQDVLPHATAKTTLAQERVIVGAGHELGHIPYSTPANGVYLVQLISNGRTYKFIR